MGAEIERVEVVLDGELVESEHRGLAARARSVVASPRIQGAAAATAGMIAGGVTLALLRRAGLASAIANTSSSPVGPTQAGWPGPTIGPIAPGTYLVRVRAISSTAPPPRRP